MKSHTCAAGWGTSCTNLDPRRTARLKLGSYVLGGLDVVPHDLHGTQHGTILLHIHRSLHEARQMAPNTRISHSPDVDVVPTAAGHSQELAAAGVLLRFLLLTLPRRWPHLDPTTVGVQPRVVHFPEHHRRHTVWEPHNHSHVCRDDLTHACESQQQQQQQGRRVQPA